MTKGIPLSPEEEKEYDRVFKEMEELKCKDVPVEERRRPVQLSLPLISAEKLKATMGG